jgi:hypothetical protein
MMNIKEMSLDKLAGDFLGVISRIKGDQELSEFKRELIKASQSEVLGISNLIP